MTSFNLHAFFGQRALTNVGEKRSELRLYVGLLLAADALFILLHLAHSLSIHFGGGATALADPKFALTFHGGFGEVFSFAQLLILTGILARIGLWTKQPIYLLWAVIYFFILIDDSFNLHSYLGSLVAPYIAESGIVGLTRQHAGELLSWFAVGIAAIAGLVQAVSHSEIEHRKIARPLLLGLGLLLFFAVGVDTIHQWLDTAPSFLDSLASIFEEGGEMIAVTLTIGAAIVISRKAALVVKTESS